MSATRVISDDGSCSDLSSLLITNHLNAPQPTTRANVLTKTQVDKFRQRIETEYTNLENSEVNYYYYINDQTLVRQARRELDKAPNGTYFVRPAEPNEQNAKVKYFLNFVCHKRIAEVPICCDDNHRTFWFLSGCGPGSEVQCVYTGIDVMIDDKKKHIFFELQYPFQIRLYRPLNDEQNPMCIPLPDEVRALAGQNTMLHELADRGLTQYFNELIRISKNDADELNTKAKFIVNKINGRNKDGYTPLILAIKAKQSKFINDLFIHKVDPNINDTQGCSPLHHACLQADPEILQELISRGADPHYVNQRETMDGVGQSNLSAFHYLAMAQDASTINITDCATLLIAEGCPLMPLTSDKKSPFDIAKSYHNRNYDCIKIFFQTRQYNNVNPIEVSSRNEAKTILSRLACPNVLGKITMVVKRIDNTNCLKNDGLFLLYHQTSKSRKQPNEFGLCVYYAGQVYVYPISHKYVCTITDLTDPSRQYNYKYSLITGTIKDNRTQVVLFESRDELIFNHTKYKGILPTILKDYVEIRDGQIEILKGPKLVLPDPGYRPVPREPELDFDVTSIKRINKSQIISIKPLNENHRRIIWKGKLRLDSTVLLSITIKDYLPKENIESYKRYRLNQFNNHSSNRTNNTDEAFPYEYTPRTELEYNHESQLLLNSLKSHPFIVHTFKYHNQSPHDLRIFMEYLPMGNLHSYLFKIDESSLDPLLNAYHWIYQLAQVMGYLSIKKIVHRDLAARNILLKSETHIKLSDFGLSRNEGTSLEKNDCTIPLRWSAPEYFDRHGIISSSADVWSFGVVIWEIYSFGSLPYDNILDTDPQSLARSLKRYLIEQGQYLFQPKSCSASMYDLMCRCWNKNIKKRPRFLDIINELNGVSMQKESIEPFNREEKRLWNKAKEYYLKIYRPIETEGDGYVQVQGHESDDEAPILTAL